MGLVPIITAHQGKQLKFRAAKLCTLFRDKIKNKINQLVGEHDHHKACKKH